MYEGKRGTSAVVVYDRALDRRAVAPPEHPARPPAGDRAGRAAPGVPAAGRPAHRPHGDRRGPPPLAAPARGLLAPVEFLPAVEQTALMGPLTEWVVTRAAADCAAWTVAGRDWVVAVNVSARNLARAGLRAAPSPSWPGRPDCAPVRCRSR